MNTEEANELLPQKTTKAVTDPIRLKYLLIAPPKWGKTTLMCAAPDSLLLAFEEGHAFHETHKIIIDAWNKPRSERGLGVDDDGNHHLSLDEAVQAIVASDRFQFIVIDTADMAAKMCLDYHYKKLGVGHASDAGDYGKGWDICLTQPFRQQIGELMKSGRGIGFITHTNIVEKKVGNTTVSRMETTLPSQVQKFLHTQADLILHGNFGKKRKGQLERDRVISLDGSNEILAGSRVRAIHLPKKFIVDPDRPWQQWAGFFADTKNVDAADQEYRDLVLGGKEEETELAAEPPAETISGESASEPESTKGTATPATTRRDRRVRQLEESVA
jgi:hypothetical protein